MARSNFRIRLGSGLARSIVRRCLYRAVRVILEGTRVKRGAHTSTSIGKEILLQKGKLACTSVI